MEQEEAIRSRLVAQKLILAGQQERMRQVIEMLYGNQVSPTLVYRNDFLKKASVARGSADKGTAEDRQDAIKVEYGEGCIRVSVLSEEPKDFTVILQPTEIYGAVGSKKSLTVVAGEKEFKEPLIGTAVWSEQEQAAVTEFSVDALEEEYRIYLA